MVSAEKLIHKFTGLHTQNGGGGGYVTIKTILSSKMLVVHEATLTR